MAKELIIYTDINRYSAESAVNQLNSIDNNEDLTVRLNTPGGGVNHGWSIISRLSERTASTNAVIDGEAQSMGAIMLLFMDNVIANDTSLIMFHKAAYPSWYEESDSEKELLSRINKQFEAKIRKKVSGKDGSVEFLAKLFEKDVRNDVELTMKEAKKLGIINEIRTLQPKAYHGTQMVAMFEDDNLLTKANDNTPKAEGSNNNNLKIESMDLVKLQAEHPAVYAQALAKGEAVGLAKEQDRVGAFMAFNEIDSKAVSEKVKSGENMTQTFMAEMSVKQMGAAKVTAMEKESPDATKTEAEVKTAEQLEIEKDEKAVAEAFGDKPKTV